MKCAYSGCKAQAISLSNYCAVHKKMKRVCVKKVAKKACKKGKFIHDPRKK